MTSFVPATMIEEDTRHNNGSALVSFIVNVTNTGPRDAADVVLGFLEPPGAGVNGVPLQTLFAFERVLVSKGEIVSVMLYPDLLSFTHVDRVGVRRSLPGTYTVRFGLRETGHLGMGLAEFTLVAE